MGLNGAQPAGLLGYALEQPNAQLGAGLLAPAEADNALDLVSALKEALDVTNLGPIVVLVNLGAKLDSPVIGLLEFKPNDRTTDRKSVV